MFLTKIKRPFFSIDANGKLKEDALEMTVTILNGIADVSSVYLGQVKLELDLSDLARIYNIREIFEEAAESFERVDRRIQPIFGKKLRRVS